MTEKEALREGYQSGIHHTNLSLGTGPARERPWRWSWACMCVSSCGRGNTACMEWQLHGRGRNWSAQVFGLSRCTVEGNRAWMLGAEFGGRFVFSLTHIHHCTLFRFILFVPSFFPIYGFISAQGTQQPSLEVILTLIPSIDYNDSVGARSEGVGGYCARCSNYSFYCMCITNLKA